MSEPTPRHILYLVVEGFPPERMGELAVRGGEEEIAEIFQLTDTSAREALEKIFAADTVAVWGQT